MQIGMIILNSIFLSNIVTGVGSGIIGLQSDKKNLLYLTLSCLTSTLGIILGELAIYSLQNYVLIPLDVMFLKTFIVVLIALIMSYISRITIKYISRESFYLYERSYQFAAQTIIFVGIMIMVDLSQTFLNSLLIVAGYCAGYLLVQIVMFGLHDKIDSRNNFKPARNVPILLYTLCILGIILSAVGMVF